MKKTVVYISILFSLFILSSCADFLEEDNKSGIENEKFYRKKAGFETLVTSTYSILREIYKETPVLELEGTDLYLKGYQVNSNYADYNFEANAKECKELYERCYKGIQYANAGLHFINLPEDMEDDEKAIAEAELRFLRAFYHFLVLEQMGGVVINKEFTDATRLSMPRSSLKDSYTFIISEIENALPKLKTAASANPGQVNQDVANHYLAKIYLTRGWDQGAESDFDKAIEYANKVIASKGGIQLSYSSVWDPTNENNQEFIFSVQFSSSEGAIGDANLDGNNQCTLYATYSGGSSGGVLRKQTAQGLLPIHFIHTGFIPNDSRYQTTFMDIFFTDYYTYYNPGAWTRDPVRNYFPRIYSEDIAFTKADTAAWKQELIDKGLTTTDKLYMFAITNNTQHYLDQVYGNIKGVSNRDERLPVVRKFDDLQNTAGNVLTRTASMRDIVLARLAETYFMKAEALIAKGSYNEAADVVQIVIDRPGNKIDPSGSDLPNRLRGKNTKTEALEAYLVEAGLEQFGEFNGRWQLLRRTRMLRHMLAKYNTDFGGTADIASRYDLRPIPEDAITLNDALSDNDQNPGF